MSNANALLAFARETLEIELTEAQRACWRASTTTSSAPANCC